MKLLKGTMFGLADYAGDPTKKHLDEIRNARELAFLITDLEGSTALAAADAKAFRHIQEIHDAVHTPAPKCILENIPAKGACTSLQMSATCKRQICIFVAVACLMLVLLQPQTLRT